jgi:hypothetical protein
VSRADTDLEPPPKSEDRQKTRFLDWLDVSAKLLGALAVVGVAFTANNFQGKMNASILTNQNRMTGLTLQSQREQAGSQLRAAMFGSLIQPFIAIERGAVIPVDREQLLAELLVLNFNEDFDSKPLMERVDRRLASEPPPKDAGGDVAQTPRGALRSMARRVADRQISSLSWDRAQAAPGEHGCEVYWLNLTAMPTESASSQSAEGCVLERRIGEQISLKSPDTNSVLEMFVLDPDWHNETVKISSVARSRTPDAKQEYGDSITNSFTLTWYDLPLADNTVLPNGNRFAINLRTVNGMTQDISLRVIWFPHGFFTPREHPLDSRRILALLEESGSQPSE